MCGQSDSFKNHLAQIKFAKACASEILSDFELPTETAMASLSRAWEMLFDSICGSNEGSVGELKDISCVIQKLSASHQKIQDIEFKKIARLKSADLNGERQKLQAMRENLQRGRLPDDIVKTVEEQLQLL
ncbi:MAG: hypothetical protein LBF49_01115 [Puniceicoccales bacterium]|jgi:hypothetical protein|nr:hypothetical protein [Puniceicoccales bacterium]